ncbi:MAG TPA: ClpXP protease specificity-enhancing factor, partial [Rhodocyclaceae bacterium]|nr:ClpXP protease specificity-enhancing factor [Rhodocyclaceae bacterium]
MVSTKPYLIRAIHEWCIDQGLTPHLAVLVDERVVVPAGYVQDGQIVLNIGPDATSKLVMGNDAISFDARFGGAAHALLIPVGNVLAVYARETGQGMAFEVERESAAGAPPSG